MKKKHLAILAGALITAPFSVSAVPVSFGALSSNDDGSTTIITDSLNNYEWLRWDALSNLSYAETVSAISAGGQYEGWQFARNTEAQLFTNALLSGLDNFCTVTGSDSCNETLPNNLTGLLGFSGGGISNEVAFLSENVDGGAGFITYTHEGDFGGLYKANDFWTIPSFDGPGDNVGWLLFRTEGGVPPPPTDVPEPATFALFGLGLAGLAIRRRRQAV